MSVTLSGATADPVLIPFAYAAQRPLAQAYANPTSTQDPTFFVPGSTPAPATPTSPLIVLGNQPAIVSTSDYGIVGIRASNAASVVGTAGNEVVIAGNRGIFYNTNGGSDVVLAGGGDNTLGTLLGASNTQSWFISGAGNDTIISGSGDNIILAGTGNNLIALNFGAGNNTVFSEGSDIVFAGAGNDTVGVSVGATVLGGSGNLTFVGGSGSSSVFGGSGSATIFGGAGTGTFQGGQAGNNIIQAADGASTVYTGGANSVAFAAGAGADTLIASAGNTTLSGGTSTGDNTFRAGDGVGVQNGVVVAGGVGKDTIFAGRGDATLFGGAGNDVFTFFRADTEGNSPHTITISDFTVGQDKLSLNGYDSLSIPLPQDAGSTTLTLPDGTKIVLQGVSLTGGLFS